MLVIMGPHVPGLLSALQSSTRGGRGSPLEVLLGHVTGRLPAHLQSGAALVLVLSVPGDVPHVPDLGHGMEYILVAGGLA